MNITDTKNVRNIRTVLVDDEILARQLLRELLSNHSDIEIVAECANGFEAVKAINDLKPDLLLLDIQMPKLNGFEVLDLIHRENLMVIFVTAYDEFALKAFEVHAADYLLKPLSAERMEKALQRAREHLNPRDRPPLAPLVETVRKGQPGLERILIRDGARVHVIPVRKIDYVEAQDDYICVKSEGKSYLKQQPMSEAEAALDPKRFIRIHRSYILNLDRLSRLEMMTREAWTAILVDGTQLPVSRKGYERLKALLQ
jgi:two-component system LytT family response regulator